MRFFRKVLWALPTFALICTFLYQKKRDLSGIHLEKKDEKPLNICTKCQVNQKKTYPKDYKISSSLKEKSNIKNSKLLVSNRSENFTNETENQDMKSQIDPQICYIQGQKIAKDALPIAYNAPGRIDVCEGIKSFLVADFIYFEPLADQLSLGTVDITNPREFEILKFNTSYVPGFKVGVGKNFRNNDWDLYAAYTYLHNTENTLFNPANKAGTFYTSWFYTNVNSFALSNMISDIKATWKMDLDKIDLELGKSYYLGSSLISRVFISLSGHRLDQRYDLKMSLSSASYSSSTKNDSWSIGPRIGLSTNWFLYKGLNIFGNLALSLMFAQNEISGSGLESSTAYNIKKIDKNILRNSEELKLGIAWGSYFTSNKWHFNLSLAYEAQRYSHTNYMSFAAQINSEANEVKPGDLFLHGLNASARFDF